MLFKYVNKIKCYLVIVKIISKHITLYYRRYLRWTFFMSIVKNFDMYKVNVNW